MTNNHVVEGATQIKVTLHDRRVLNGKVIGTDKLTDIAVVKVDAHDLPAITWGDQQTAAGPDSACLWQPVRRAAVQRDARHRQRCESGCTLLRRCTHARRPHPDRRSRQPRQQRRPSGQSHGELVGINQMIATNSGQFAGASFAIPSSTAKAIADQIIGRGRSTTATSGSA